MTFHAHTHTHTTLNCSLNSPFSLMGISEDVRSDDPGRAAYLQTFETLDTDGSGTVSWAEFSTFFSCDNVVKVRARSSAGRRLAAMRSGTPAARSGGLGAATRAADYSDDDSDDPSISDDDDDDDDDWSADLTSSNDDDDDDDDDDSDGSGSDDGVAAARATAQKDMQAYYAMRKAGLRRRASVEGAAEMKRNLDIVSGGGGKHHVNLDDDGDDYDFDDAIDEREGTMYQGQPLRGGVESIPSSVAMRRNMARRASQDLGHALLKGALTGQVRGGTTWGAALVATTHAVVKADEAVRTDMEMHSQEQEEHERLRVEHTAAKKSLQEEEDARNCTHSEEQRQWRMARKESTEARNLERAERDAARTAMKAETEKRRGETPVQVKAREAAEVSARIRLAEEAAAAKRAAKDKSDAAEAAKAAKVRDDQQAVVAAAQREKQAAEAAQATQKAAAAAAAMAAEQKAEAAIASMQRVKAKKNAPWAKQEDRHLREARAKFKDVGDRNDKWQNVADEVNRRAEAARAPLRGKGACRKRYKELGKMAAKKKEKKGTWLSGV